MKHIYTIILILLITGCQQAQQDTIRVGVVSPLTGPAAFFGEWGKAGFEIAAERYENETGKHIELVYEDDQCDSAPALTAANKLRQVDGIQVMVGLLCGGPTQAVAPWTEENNAVMVSAGDSFGHLSDNLYSTRFLIHEEGRMLAEVAYNELHLRRIGIIYFQNEWGDTLQKDFTDRFTQLGGTVVGADPYPFGAPDFRTTLLKFKEEDVDGVYMIYNTIGDIVNQMEELRMDVAQLGDSQIENEQSANIGGKNLEGTVYMRPVSPNASSTHEFDAIYEEKYGQMPDTIARDAHDALIVLLHAVEQCGQENVDCIKETIQQTRDLPGANGMLTFNNELWGFEKAFVVKIFKDGEFREYTGQ